MTEPAVHGSLGESMAPRQKWLLLGSLMIALFLAALDQTIVATATPRLLSDLGGFNLLSWLFTSYLLASTVVVPIVGKLSDTFGRKHFLIAGILLFIGASAACGLAPSIELLIVFRAVQGLGAGVIFATVFATTGDLFSPAERGKYMGFFTGVFSLASIIGPTLGGFLTDTIGWRWVFYVNVPVALVALPAIWMNLPSRPPLANRPRIDFLGAALLTCASVALLLGLEMGSGDHSWTSGLIIGLFGLAVVMTVAFIFQEMRHPDPVVPLHLFRNRTFVSANLVVFTLGMAMFGGFAYLPTFVQTGLETSATASGIITTPQSLGLMVTSIIGGQIIARTGRYKYQTVVGTLFLLAATMLLMTVDKDMPRWVISLYMIVLGAGIGLVLPTMGLASQNAVPYQYLGVATSANQFARQIGGVLGVAVFGVVLANSYSGSFERELPEETRAALPPSIVTEFENPTVRLDEVRFAALEQEILALPDGENLLGSAMLAVRQSIEDAIGHVFLGASLVAVLAVVAAVTLKEIPLRRGSQPTGGPPAESDEEVQLVPAAGAPAPQPGGSPIGGAGGGGSG